MKATTIRPLFLLTLAGLLTMSKPSPAYGQVEVEANPVAYILDGYSGPIAYLLGPVRVSVGGYAISAAIFHGHEAKQRRDCEAGLPFANPERTLCRHRFRPLEIHKNRNDGALRICYPVRDSTRKTS